MQENEKINSTIATTTIEFDVKVKVLDKAKGVLIDALASGGKMTKADSGRVGYVNEESLTVTLDPCDDGGCGCPKISLTSSTKSTKADAGRTA